MVWPTGSSEATIIVSVSSVVRFLVASTPMSRMLIRSVALERAVPGAPSAVARISWPAKTLANVFPRMPP